MGRPWMQLWKWWEACPSNGAMLLRHLRRRVWNIETLGRFIVEMWKMRALDFLRGKEEAHYFWPANGYVSSAVSQATNQPIIGWVLPRIPGSRDRYKISLKQQFLSMVPMGWSIQSGWLVIPCLDIYMYTHIYICIHIYIVYVYYIYIFIT